MHSPSFEELLAGWCLSTRLHGQKDRLSQVTALHVHQPLSGPKLSLQGNVLAQVETKHSMLMMSRCLLHQHSSAVPHLGAVGRTMSSSVLAARVLLEADGGL